MYSDHDLLICSTPTTQGDQEEINHLQQTDDGRGPAEAICLVSDDEGDAVDQDIALQPQPEPQPPQPHEIERSDSLNPSEIAQLFPNSFAASDLKHVCDNILHEVLESLPWWQSLYSSLGAMEALLKRPTYRERFLYGCMGHAAESDRNVFRSWNASIRSLRWECIVAFLEELLAVEVPLRRFWDLNKFTHGGRGADGVRLRDENLVDIQRADQAMRDPEFWVACRVLRTLAFEAEYVGRWAEGCPCHDSGDQDQACPFRGCRAAELASGDWKGTLQRHLKFHSSTHNACVAEFSQYLADINKARGKMWYLLEVKLHYWKELPWRLCTSACLSVGKCWLQWKQRNQVE